MRFIFTVLLFSAVASQVLSQPHGNLPEAPWNRLDLRYQSLKLESQTFKRNNQVYKVVKVNVLDAFWKTVKDSLQRQQEFLTRARVEIDTLTKQKNTSEQMLSVQSASIQESLFDRNHITIIGIPFTKSLFTLLFVTLVGGLVCLFSITLARMKYANSMMKEKAHVLESMTSEFEQFKKKSLERQIKLSRQLQDERNKLNEVHIKKMLEIKNYQ